MSTAAKRLNFPVDLTWLAGVAVKLNVETADLLGVGA
jgi:hypothetical protein